MGLVVYSMEGFSAQISTEQKKTHFLAVYSQMKNELTIVLEFARHYIEEGVDHIFLYDDSSSDGTIEAVRKCLPSSLVTVYTPSDVEAVLKRRVRDLVQYHMNGVMYEHFLRDQTGRRQLLR